MDFTRRETVIGTSGIVMGALSGCTDVLDSADPSIAAASNLDEEHLGTVENDDGGVSEIWITFSELSASWQSMPDPVGQVYIAVREPDLDETVFESVHSGDWESEDNHEFTSEDDIGGDLIADTSIRADTFDVEEDGAEETFEIPLMLEVGVNDAAGDRMHVDTFDLLVEFTVVNVPEDAGTEDETVGDAPDDDGDNEEPDPEDADEEDDGDDVPGEEENEGDEDDGPDDEEPGDGDDDQDGTEDEEDGDPSQGDDEGDDGNASDPNEIHVATAIEEGGTYAIASDFEADETAIRVTTDEDVTIEGNGHTIVGDADNLAIDPGSAHVTVRNLTVVDFHAGCRTTLGTTLTLENVTVRDGALGLAMTMSGDVTVRSCTFTGLSDTVFHAQDLFTSALTVEDCDISECGTVLWQDQSSEVIVRRTRVRSAGTIVIGGGEIVDCELSFDADPGIEISADRSGGMGGSSTRIEGNEIDANRDAIGVAYGYAAVVGNTIDGRIVVDTDELYGMLDPLRHNNITGDSCVFNGVAGDEGETIEATCNWWNHEDGPDHADNSNDAPGAVRVSGDVAYDPWMVEPIEADTDLDAACDGTLDSAITAQGTLIGAVS